MGSKICISNKLFAADTLGPWGHNFSSTDSQDLERERGVFHGENNIRGMNMEIFRQEDSKATHSLITQSRLYFFTDYLRVYNMLHAVLGTRIQCEQDEQCPCNQEAYVQRSSQIIDNLTHYRLFLGVLGLEESKTEREPGVTR